MDLFDLDVETVEPVVKRRRSGPKPRPARRADVTTELLADGWSGEGLLVSTDGSCYNNPTGVAGWAWYLDDSCWGADGVAVGSNQFAEVSAIADALEAIPLDEVLTIQTDSKYALQLVVEWSDVWQQLGWTRYDGGEIRNLDLVKRARRAFEAREAPVDIRWCRGHRGDRLNEAADARAGAVTAALAAREPIPRGPGWSARR